MTDGLFLALGLGLFLRLREEKKRKKKRQFIRRTLELTAAVIAVIATDLLLTHYLWLPAGRIEFRWVAILLGCFLLDGGKEQWFLPLAGISLWAAEHEWTLSWMNRFLAAGLLVVLAQAFREFLAGIQERLIFSNVPKILQGLPILFLTAAIGALVLQGITGLVRPF